MSDTITFSCNHCGSTLTVPASLAGVSGPCPVCGQTITSPRSAPSPAAPAPVPAPPAPAPIPASVAPTEIPPPRAPEPVPSPKATLPPPREEKPPPPWGQPSTDTAPVPLYDPPRASSGSPLAYTLAVVLILGGVGAAAWHFFRPFFDRTPIPEKPGDTVTAPAVNEPAKVSDPAPVKPEQPRTPPSPAVAPVVAPEVKPPPVVTTVPPVPEPEPAPQPDPGPVVPTPGSIAIENVVPPAPPDPAATPADMQESMVREFQSRLDAFFQAATPQARGPLLFSEIEDASSLNEAVQKGSLSKIPKLEYKAVIAFDGPRQGISQYYVAVTNTAADEDAPDREILLHLANHDNKGFRVNADVLRFQLANDLPKFAAQASAAPLRSYVFIERAHFFSGERQESPRGHVCVNLRLGPYTPVICQALVDLGSEAGVEVAPLVNWGDSPKAVVVTLKHATVDGLPAITIDQFHCGNWLVAYPKAADESAP